MTTLLALPLAFAELSIRFNVTSASWIRMTELFKVDGTTGSSKVSSSSSLLRSSVKFKRVGGIKSAVILLAATLSAATISAVGKLTISKAAFI